MTLNQTEPIEDRQSKLWNGVAARGWVEVQEQIDRVFKPIEDLLVEESAAFSGGSVLDVGCGTGSIALAVARKNEAKSRCLGIDISAQMIAAARVRAERECARVSFLEADAQSHPFEPASFDLILSRFGVMFFTDPIKAFINLRRAAGRDAELIFVAWRSPRENPFMTEAERAAAPLLPDLPPRQLDKPGPFAFAERDRLSRILDQGGWREVTISPLDVPCSMPEKDLVPYLSNLGPVGHFLQGADEDTRSRVISVIRGAFDPYVHGAEVRFVASCWKVNARA